MKRKVLAGLLCAALLISTFSIPVAAKESNAGDTGVKLEEIEENVRAFAEELKENECKQDVSESELKISDIAIGSNYAGSAGDWCANRIKHNGNALKYYIQSSSLTDDFGRKRVYNQMVQDGMIFTTYVTQMSDSQLWFTTFAEYTDYDYPYVEISIPYYLNSNTCGEVYAGYHFGIDSVVGWKSFDTGTYSADNYRSGSYRLEYPSEWDPSYNAELCGLFDDVMLIGLFQVRGITNMLGFNMSDIGFYSLDQRIAYSHMMANAGDKSCALCGAYVLPFVDVSSDAWYFKYVADVFDGKYMTGLTANTFGPVDTLARAQFAIILHRMNGTPSVAYTDIFKDVPAGQWYTDAVIWANEKKVVTGYSDGNFGVNDNITREQMALMMFRYADAMGYNTEERASFAAYTDAGSVSDYAEEAMQWAVGTGIITGKDGGTRLDPWGYASRAECAAIIMRFVKAYNIG